MDKFCVVCEKTTKAPDPDGFYQIGGGVMLCVCLPCRERVNIGRLVEFELETLEGKRDKDGQPRPTVVCLCGSTRFIEEFRAANLRETLAGWIVLSIGCDTKSDSDLLALGELTEEKKAALDELHKRKIDLADEILVLNVGGYVGSSTRSEIEYAEKAGKRVRWLEEARGKGEG